MIVNARMYSVSPAAAALWRTLLLRIAAEAAVPMTWVDHAEPAPIEELWRRTDQGAVFMCGLPFAGTEPSPVLVAAPVPSPPEFGGEPRYWSDFVVRQDSGFRTVQDTFGSRLALTVPDSQSGCVAALSYFMAAFPPHAATQPDAATPAVFSVPPPATALTSATATAPATATNTPNDAQPLFSEVIAPTITPLGALDSVIRGNADVAPIDSYALRLLQRYRPDLTAQVRIIGQTDPTPIPPLVASPSVAGMWTGAQQAPLQAAFLEAHRNASIKACMDQLLLARFAQPAPESYATLRQRFEAVTAYWHNHRLAAAVHPAFAA